MGFLFIADAETPMPADAAVGTSPQVGSGANNTAHSVSGAVKPPDQDAGSNVKPQVLQL